MTYCTFYLEQIAFGVEIRRVEEVLLNLPVTRVPLASALVEGLMNLRGQIVVAVNLRRLLLSRSNQRHAPQVSVVVNSTAGLVSLQADRYGDVVELDPDRFEAPLATLDHPFRSKLKAVYQDGETILHLLDLDPLLAF